MLKEWNSCLSYLMKEVQSMFDQMRTINSFISAPSTRYLPIQHTKWVHFSLLLLGCQNNTSIILLVINMFSWTSNNRYYYYTFLGTVFGNFGDNLGHSQNEIFYAGSSGTATPQVLSMWPWTLKIGWKKVKTLLFGSTKWFWHNVFVQFACLG
jgi:hypothetical protein